MIIIDPRDGVVEGACAPPSHVCVSYPDYIKMCEILFEAPQVDDSKPYVLIGPGNTVEGVDGCA